MTTEAEQSEIPDLVEHDGEVFLRGATCKECGETMFPHRKYCIECLHETAPCRLDRLAELECVTEVFAGPPRFGTPYVAGFVRLSPGDVRTFAYLDGDADEFALGDDVEVAAGSIAESADWVFRPVERTHAE